MRLETTGAIDMPLEDLPSGIFVVCKDGPRTMVIPVAEESLNNNRTSAAALMHTVRETTPKICIDTVEDYTAAWSDDVSGAAGDECSVSSGHQECSSQEWRNIQHPSHRLMTRRRPTVCGTSVYACPMEALVISRITSAVGAQQLTLVQSLHAFELQPSQFADLSPVLGAMHPSGRCAVAYRTCPPDLPALQAAHRWLASGPSRDTDGGAFVFVHGSVIRRPCPCGSGGLSVSVYSPSGAHQVDTDRLATDYTLVEIGGALQLCRQSDAYSKGSVHFGGRGFGVDVHLLGRATGRSLNACAIVYGADPCSAVKDAGRLYDPLLFVATDDS